MTVNRTTDVRSTFDRFLAVTEQLLLPATCCLCDSPGSLDPRGTCLDLCAICAERLPKNAHACVACALPIGDLDLCESCRNEPPPFDRAFAPYIYRYPMRHLVRGLKFQGHRAYGRLLGELLAAARVRVPAPLPEMLLPIPLHASRYRDRGFNQAHEIARFAARSLHLPLAPHALVRVTPTLEQSGLTIEARRGNVRDAFAVHRLPRARRLALVDDVLTTGSTAAEAARVLKAVGIEHVEIWAPARVALVRRVSPRTR